jgi:hypothetical protein
VSQRMPRVVNKVRRRLTIPSITTGIGRKNMSRVLEGILEGYARFFFVCGKKSRCHSLAPWHLKWASVDHRHSPCITKPAQ